MNVTVKHPGMKDVVLKIDNGLLHWFKYGVEIGLNDNKYPIIRSQEALNKFSNELNKEYKFRHDFQAFDFFVKNIADKHIDLIYTICWFVSLNGTEYHIEGDMTTKQVLQCIYNAPIPRTTIIVDAVTNRSPLIWKDILDEFRMKVKNTGGSETDLYELPDSVALIVEFACDDFFNEDDFFIDLNIVYIKWGYHRG